MVVFKNCECGHWYDMASHDEHIRSAHHLYYIDRFIVDELLRICTEMGIL